MSAKNIDVPSTRIYLVFVYHQLIFFSIFAGLYIGWFITGLGVTYWITLKTSTWHTLESFLDVGLSCIKHRRSILMRQFTGIHFKQCFSTVKCERTCTMAHTTCGRYRFAVNSAYTLVHKYMDIDKLILSLVKKKTLQNRWLDQEHPSGGGCVIVKVNSQEKTSSE